MLKVLCHSSQAGGSSSCPPALSQPHMPFPALEDSRVALGVPVLLRVTLQAGPVTASMGGFAALPSLGKMVYLCSSDPPCPPKPRAGQQALSSVSCMVALQIDRVGTALQLPVLPYLGPATLSWGSMAAGRAVALGALCGIWDPLCHRGVQGHWAELPSGAEQAAGLAGTPAWGQCHGDNPWDSPGAGRAWGTQGHCLCHCSARWGACATVWGMLQAPGLHWVTRGTKPGGPHSPMAWDRLRPGLDPVPSPARVCPGQGQCGPCCHPEATEGPRTPCVAGQGP